MKAADPPLNLAPDQRDPDKNVCNRMQGFSSRVADSPPMYSSEGENPLGPTREQSDPSITHAPSSAPPGSGTFHVHVQVLPGFLGWSPEPHPQIPNILSAASTRCPSLVLRRQAAALSVRVCLIHQRIRPATGVIPRARLLFCPCRLQALPAKPEAVRLPHLTCQDLSLEPLFSGLTAPPTTSRYLGR